MNIDRYNISFELSQPFQPLEQLLAVLPAESSHALPPSVRWLMMDDESPIKDLYDSDSIAIDPNGKHLPWLWILLLPFIDEKRIQSAFQTCKSKLNIEELRRNAFSGSYIFTHKRHALSTHLFTEPMFQYKPAPEDNQDILNAIKNLQTVDIESMDTNIKEEPMDDGTDIATVTTATDSIITNTLNQAQMTEEELVTDVNVGKTELSLLKKENKNTSEIIYFDALSGDGILGGVAPPKMTWYFRLDTKIAAPKQPPLAFCDVAFNQVLCLTFLYPLEQAYNSCLLSGYIPKDRQLDANDLIPRRPPKLNKSRFNMLELSKEYNRNQNQQQGQGQVGSYGGNYGGGSYGGS